ncbi:putative vacuolar membrane protein [Escovopsis weberi]|uniref:Putative vacuolar membrane protein n=1 Tax=Escovopsis weberi TaxID=150374 RepID=A0A0M8N0K0_ESCWE|nr:putative vacuolar membrane protein [Escovopsis weberi]
MAPGTRRPELYPEHPEGQPNEPLLSDDSDDSLSYYKNPPDETGHLRAHLDAADTDRNLHDKQARGRSPATPYRAANNNNNSTSSFFSSASASSLHEPRAQPTTTTSTSLLNSNNNTSNSNSTAMLPSRRSALRSRSPSRAAAAASSAHKRYTYAAVFLVVGLVSFCVQTELSAYIQGELGWQKAYCMMFITHSSWALVWPVQLLVLRVQKRALPWPVFWRRHVHALRSSALMVELQALDVLGIARPAARSARYLLRTTALLTCALTVAGLSWYVAVSMTTPSDLTAIYNCSAFFAYAFSVPILREPLRLDKSLAVLVAIVGVLIVAYGDGADPGSGPGSGSGSGPGSDPAARFLGNIIIGVGSVLYGLYEVLYKRLACGPPSMSPGRAMVFSNFFASCIGAFTLAFLWLPLVPLHALGIEPFEIPDAPTCRLILVAVLANATFSASFLILIALTSPVLSSVSALLTIFIIALADWRITGRPPSSASLLGGAFIVCAFLALSWSTYREMMDDEVEKKRVDIADSDDDDDADIGHHHD